MAKKLLSAFPAFLLSFHVVSASANNKDFVEYPENEAAPLTYVEKMVVSGDCKISSKILPAELKKFGKFEGKPFSKARLSFIEQKYSITPTLELYQNEDGEEWLKSSYYGMRINRGQNTGDTITGYFWDVWSPDFLHRVLEIKVLPKTSEKQTVEVTFIVVDSEIRDPAIDGWPRSFGVENKPIKFECSFNR